jgi:hypothetical protein
MDDDTVGRALDATVEIPAITDALADAIVDADDGPPCGSAEAVTNIWVGYLLQGMMHVNEGQFCCARHVPADHQQIPRGAGLMEVVIQDGLTQTTFRPDGSTRVLVNWDYMIGDTATFPPTWPNGKNVLVLADFTVIPT